MAEEISRRLRLVAVPLRVRMIDHLRRHGATPVQVLADELGAQEQSVSKALVRLYHEGIVERHPDGRQVWYALADTTVLAVYAHAAEGVRRAFDPNIDATRHDENCPHADKSHRCDHI